MNIFILSILLVYFFEVRPAHAVQQLEGLRLNGEHLRLATLGKLLEVWMLLQQLPQDPLLL